MFVFLPHEHTEVLHICESFCVQGVLRLAFIVDVDHKAVLTLESLEVPLTSVVVSRGAPVLVEKELREVVLNVIHKWTPEMITLLKD